MCPQRLRSKALMNAFLPNLHLASDIPGVIEVLSFYFGQPRAQVTALAFHFIQKVCPRTHRNTDYTNFLCLENT